ncbi:MAG: P1 family peptidase, partial [Actinomycetota bacterium]|nr:P1 family peptidase [Actinomycetota bacterium]
GERRITLALGIDGLRIGCWTSSQGPSGCTVVLPPPGTLGALAVRGSAPGTREAIALGAAGKVTVCHAVVLSGGSAFGLATADGVTSWLEERSIGYPTRTALVPIVGAAIVLDQGVAERAARPGPAAGRAACDAAVEEEPPEGSVGAGTGCTVAKVGGFQHAWRGGQGIAVQRAGGVTVGAVVINNAFGEIRDEDGKWIARSRAPRGAPRFPEVLDPDAASDAANLPGGSGEPPRPGWLEGGELLGGPSENTVIGCVASDARLTKHEGVRVADLAHSGVSRTVLPAHTSLDGDAIFCLSTGKVESHVDLVAALAADVVAEACRRAVRAAVSRDGLPGLATEGRRAGGV